jgi:hypothetical protein
MFYRSLEIGMFIMSKNKTTPRCSHFEICNEDRYIEVLLQRISICAAIGQLAEHRTFSF